MVRVDRPSASASAVEVPEKPERRKFTAEYKLRILKEADTYESGSGELGSLLRREGLYASILSSWRRQRYEGTLAALEPKKRGRKAVRRDASAVEIERLKREVVRLQQRVEQAEVIISVQKKLSQLLGIELPKFDDESGMKE